MTVDRLTSFCVMSCVGAAIGWGGMAALGVAPDMNEVYTRIIGGFVTACGIFALLRIVQQAAAPQPRSSQVCGCADPDCTRGCPS